MENIRTSLQALNLTIDDEQFGKLYHFYKSVVEENTKINLTAITDYDEFILKHYVDSLSIYLLKDDFPEVVSLLKRPDSKILDLGTGGGFPGIPLSIVFPQAKYTLLDSLQKRIRFLQSVTAELSLPNVAPIHARAEDFAHQSTYREQFDLCVSRAVANLSTLVEYVLPFVKVGGYFVSYKGTNAEEEIREAEFATEELGGEIAHIGQFVLPTLNLDINTAKSKSGFANKELNAATSFSENETTAEQPRIHRTLVIIKKIKSPTNKYPRKAGIPSKKPLTK